MKKRKLLFVVPTAAVLIVSLVLSLKAGTSGENDLTNSVENACSNRGSIYGTVVYFQSCYMQYMQAAQIELKGNKTGVKEKVNTNRDGEFVFDDLKADTYKITASKNKYKNDKVKIKLDSGRARFVELELKKK
ncbi:MAG: carboxypeptidase regulatory-like domain-containing protein [Candidatus Kuenenia sp.]|nr:carboxypeptidase regulatory-like domain-containing protein [Candidatus Kuenenia hertensis]